MLVPGVPDHGPDTGMASAPTCRRHPDRLAYVRCQRCGRPICPECQRPAAVGVQCIDCIQQQQKAVRRTTTVLGARAPASDKPLVTYSIIGVCVAMFVIQIATRGAWTSRFAFSAAAGAIEPWRFLTSAFLHSTTFYGHILFNMWALYVTGRPLEHLLGRARFVALCVLTAIGGSVGFLLFAGSPGQQSWVTGAVGASGMVFGLFGALVPVLRRVGGDARQIIGLIAINGVFGFVVPGIAWQAHLGGLLVGLGLGYAFAHSPRKYQQALAWLAPALVFVILTGLALWKYQATGWLQLIN